jgi:hypothetical protein
VTLCKSDTQHNNDGMLNVAFITAMRRVFILIVVMVNVVAPTPAEVVLHFEAKSGKDGRLGTTNNMSNCLREGER